MRVMVVAVFSFLIRRKYGFCFLLEKNHFVFKFLILFFFT